MGSPRLPPMTSGTATAPAYITSTCCRPRVKSWPGGSMRSTSSTGRWRCPAWGEGGLVSFMNTSLLATRATGAGKIVKAEASGHCDRLWTGPFFIDTGSEGAAQSWPEGVHKACSLGYQEAQGRRKEGRFAERVTSWRPGCRVGAVSWSGGDLRLVAGLSLFGRVLSV